ncbi:DUF3368 domain-containing protein [Nodosilinea nodulosa]|uniref:DUF3368 domain-containing protein n=1 Tax=Nodosilinea nodulosa TaxID=416001 RepID=UPI003BF4E0C3
MCPFPRYSDDRDRGALVLAKRRGLIPAVAEPLQALRDAGLWISEDVMTLLKHQAGE